MSKATEKEVKQTEAQTAETATVQEPPKKKAFEITLIDQYVEEGMEQIIVNQLRKNVNRDPIVIYLTTNGGDPRVAMFINDIVSSENLPVTIIAGSMVGSAGTLISNMPNALRLCYSTSVFMYHHGTKRNISFSQEEFDYCNSTLAGLAEDIRKQYEYHIGVDPKFIKKNLLSGVDKYYVGDEILQLGTKGAVDGVILFHHGDHVYDIRTRTGIHRIDLVNDDVSKFRVTEPTEYVSTVSATIEFPAKK